MKKIILLALFSFLFFTNSNAACDDPLTEGVDYSNCRFSDSQDLQGSYLPNSNLSFASFIQVNFDKSIMMTSNLSFGTFPESTFVRALTKVDSGKVPNDRFEVIIMLLSKFT